MAYAWLHSYTFSTYVLPAKIGTIFLLRGYLFHQCEAFNGLMFQVVAVVFPVQIRRACTLVDFRSLYRFHVVCFFPTS